MGNIQIRKAKRIDMPEVARLFMLSRNHFLPYLPVLHTEEEDLQFFTDEVFEQNQVWIAVAQETKSLVGFVAFNQKFVNHLYLLPGYERKGLGARLLEIAQNATKKLCLWTFQKNSGAIAFYKKHGFKAIKMTDGINNEEKEPDVLMEWSLD